MPKSMFIHPDKVRKADFIKIQDIPVNQYKSDFSSELEKFGRETLIQIYYHMLIIREFETMIQSSKIHGSYMGVTYTHRGPAHLSIGQEAAAVGQSVHLDINDFIFGSHRSHGETIAKCFSAVNQLKEDELLEIMKAYSGGACFKVVEKENTGTIKELAEDFILYGLLAEIFGRSNGFNRGLGGSMHAFFTPFGSMPNNAIVGGSAGISAGSALFKRINRKPGIVICNLGDASMGCGPVWEALIMTSMDQYHTLWDKKVGGAPPILFNFFDNFYGMGGQTSGETMGYGILARVGAGVNPENLHAERIDGYNPLAVADAIKRKKKILLAGEGPVLLDTITYRTSGHSTSDASTYRDKEEVAAWERVDCIREYEKYLMEHNLLSSSIINVYKDKVKEKIRKTLKLASSLEISRRIKGNFIEKVMFSNQRKDKMEDGEPEVLIPKKDNPRVLSISRKSRFGFDENGNQIPKARVFSYRDAIFEAMLHWFYKDPTMIAYGEDNRDWNGAFGVYRGLTEALPYHRLFNTSISEAAIIGSGVGYALSGGRAVVELMYCDFMGRAGDELFNQLPKWQSMSAGELSLPLVIRVSVGNKYGAQHSQDWSALVAHMPGLKAMFPATPYDAKGMLNLALKGTDPVIFFESQKLYDIGEQFVAGGVPEDYYEISEGEPVIRREGSDVTIISLGATLYTAILAANDLESKYNISTEVIDLRFINPLNYNPLIESIKKTGKAVIVSDACERASFSHTVASNMVQFAFDYLDAPIAVIGSRNWITPAAEMESFFFPQKEWIIDVIHEKLHPLPGHQVISDHSISEQIRRNKFGV